MRKKIGVILVLILLTVGAGFFFLSKPAMAQKIIWGVVFSQKHARDMGLDWKENYLAILDGLKAKNIKLAAHWDLLEPQRGVFDFSDLDWQLEQANRRGAKIMLVAGMKTPRWPECHIPEWAKNIGKSEQQEEILRMLETLANRYKNNLEISSWQVENEPLFAFGNCPWIDQNFLKKEAALMRTLDSGKRPIVISDSGEASWWFKAASIGDIVGITMYRRVFFHELQTYVTYPIPPAFYRLKTKLIGLIFKKPVICGELQVEPWAANQIYDGAAGDAKTMDIAQLKNNIVFAQRTGIDTFYLWGSEWWYWMKAKHGQPQYWEEIKTILK